MNNILAEISSFPANFYFYSDNSSYPSGILFWLVLSLNSSGNEKVNDHSILKLLAGILSMALSMLPPPSPSSPVFENDHWRSYKQEDITLKRVM